MTTAPLPEKPGATPVTFYLHGFGLRTLPAIHELPGAIQELLNGDIAGFLMQEEVPKELVEELATLTKEEVGRFFQGWIIAGYDLEVAHWNWWLAMERSMPDLGLNMDDPEEEAIAVDRKQGQNLAALMFDQLDDILEAVVDAWNLHK